MKSITKPVRLDVHHRHLAAPARGLAARSTRLVRFVAPASAAALLAAGCASTQIGAQWVDPQWPKNSMQGAAVLVICEAQDTTVRLLCESRFAARLTEIGAKPLTAPATADAQAGREPDAAARLAAAKAAGARAVLHTTLRPDYTAVSSGPSFSIGVGGYGGSGGGSRGGVGGGVGIALPVGAPSGAGMAASSTLVDVASGKLVWSAQASAPASSDAASQIDELAGVLVGAVARSGLF